MRPETADMNKKKFSELNLSPEIMKGVTDMGFEEATAIQTATIPLMMNGADLIGQAQTGTGKTAAFGIPLLEMVNRKSRDVQALIMCPTRELAVQVAEEIGKIGKHKKGLKTLAVYGGQPIFRQIKALQAGAQIVAGTPGRLIDHIERRTIKLESCGIVVLDEADEMLNMGFVEDIEVILKSLPVQRQTVLFSATMPPPILAITKRYQKNPQTVKITHEVLTAPSIDQVYFEIKRGAKLEALCRLLDVNDFNLSLIFCNTKMMVDELERQLTSRGYMCEALHGDKTQQQRDRVMDKVRSNKADILIATDVAARGIDVEGIDAVFNYDVPADEEYYVHRIGRTGRAGRLGKSFTLVYPDEIHKMRDIQRYARTKIRQEKIPTKTGIDELKAARFAVKIKELIAKGSLESEIKTIEKIMQEDLTSTEIAAALLKMEYEREQKSGAATGEDVNAPERIYAAEKSRKPVRGRRDWTASFGSRTDYGRREGSFERRQGGGPVRGRDNPGTMVKLFLSVGKSHGAQVRDILGAVAGEAGIQGSKVGRIDLQDKGTFVHVEKSCADIVVRKMAGIRIKGIKVHAAKTT